jgi:dipeptidyl aminopeptidase/acylaminoacyl peptidase
MSPHPTRRLTRMLSKALWGRDALPGLLTLSALLAVLALLPARLLASPAAAVPAEAFFAQPDLSAASLSPSGRWLALLVRGAAERNMLVVVDLDNPTSQATALARFSDVDIEAPRWVGDERLVFSITDWQRGSSDQQYAPGLFSVPREGGFIRQLVKLRDDAIVTTAAVGPDRRLAWNHQLLHVPRQQPGQPPEVIVGELAYDNRGMREGVVPKRLDVASGRVRGLAGPLPEGEIHRWMFDAAGEARVATVNRQGRVQVLGRAPGQDSWAPLLRDAPWLEMPWAPYALDHDGALFVTVTRGAGGTRELARLDPATGNPRHESLVRTPGFDFDGEVVSDADEARILGFRVQTDAETTVWLDARLAALQTQIDERLPGRINRLSCRRCGSEAMVVLVQSWSDQDPGSLWVWRAASKSLSLVGRRRKPIDPQQMATVDFQTITTRDARSMPLWLTRPPGTTADGRAPAIVLVHGGPWSRGGHWVWKPMQQWLASRGYVVIEPEFRGSTGYGSEHFRAGWRQWGRTMQDDVADAVLWATKHKLIDPKRVCIAGASYGGYATLMGLIRHPELYRCGAAWVGVTDPLLLLQPSWWWGDDISEEGRKYGYPTLLGDPEKDLEMLKSVSPVLLAAQIKAPVLLAYGEGDRRVPLVHGRRMRSALQEAGREPEWITYPGEGHGFGLLQNEADFARRLEVFFGQHLKP